MTTKALQQRKQRVAGSWLLVVYCGLHIASQSFEIISF